MKAHERFKGSVDGVLCLLSAAACLGMATRVSGTGNKSEIRGHLHKVQVNLYFSEGELRSTVVAYSNAVG